MSFVSSSALEEDLEDVVVGDQQEKKEEEGEADLVGDHDRLLRKRAAPERLDQEKKEVAAVETHAVMNPSPQITCPVTNAPVMCDWMMKSPQMTVMAATA